MRLTRNGSQCRYDFTSWGDFTAYIDSLPESEGHYSVKPNREYAHDTSWRDTVTYAHKGWIEGAVKAREIADRLRSRVAAKLGQETIHYDVTGAMFDVVRVNEGIPECWQSWEATNDAGTARRFVKLAQNIAVSCGVDAKTVIARAGAVAALVELLEMAGCGVEFRVLPGIGPLATIAMLTPVTFSISPVGALIMLAGIYYGAQYGGSTTAILVNLPGETSSVVTCLDGYQMARQGRAGPALAIAAIGSFFAGTVCTLIIAVFGPAIAELALEFGPTEYFALMLMGLVAAAMLSQGDMVKSLAMVAMGLLLGVVGTDVNSGWRRFSFDIAELADGR